jgi:hypothetical protein
LYEVSKSLTSLELPQTSEDVFRTIPAGLVTEHVVHFLQELNPKIVKATIPKIKKAFFMFILLVFEN